LPWISVTVPKILDNNNINNKFLIINPLLD
jgi:hypothetical protein